MFTKGDGIGGKIHVNNPNRLETNPTNLNLQAGGRYAGSINRISAIAKWIQLDVDIAQEFAIFQPEVIDVILIKATGVLHILRLAGGLSEIECKRALTVTDAVAIGKAIGHERHRYEARSQIAVKSKAEYIIPAFEQRDAIHIQVLAVGELDSNRICSYGSGVDALSGRGGGEDKIQIALIRPFIDPEHTAIANGFQGRSTAINKEYKHLFPIADACGIRKTIRRQA